MTLDARQQAITLRAKLFRGFSDPSRLTILESLRTSRLTVTEIVEATGLGQSNVSNHLACLRECGLVSREQEGRYVWYMLSDERVGEILRVSEELLGDVARGVYECTRYEVLNSAPMKESEGAPGCDNPEVIPMELRR